MPCKRLQPSYRSSANSLTLVPTGTTEYIATGDSQAAVPFPTESEGISTFSERQLQVFPICCYSLLRSNVAASVTPASSSRPLLTQYTGRNWLNAKIVESCEGVRCRPARSSADVCQRGTVRQRMGGGNTPGGVSPHPQGAWLALRLVRQGDGLHYPVGQPLFGDSLPFLLPSVAVKELLGASDAPGAGHIYAQCSYGTQQH